MRKIKENMKIDIFHAWSKDQETALRAKFS
jgi:hypothetical protein